MKIDRSSGTIETHDFQIAIYNTQETSITQNTTTTLALLSKMIRHTAVRELTVCLIITGGFDNRLVTTLVREYYCNAERRTSTRKGEESLNYTLLHREAKGMSMPLTVDETDIEQQKEWFYFVSESTI